MKPCYIKSNEKGVNKHDSFGNRIGRWIWRFHNKNKYIEIQYRAVANYKKPIGGWTDYELLKEYYKNGCLKRAIVYVY